MDPNENYYNTAVLGDVESYITECDENEYPSKIADGVEIPFPDEPPDPTLTDYELLNYYNELPPDDPPPYFKELYDDDEPPLSEEIIRKVEMLCVSYYDG